MLFCLVCPIQLPFGVRRWPCLPLISRVASVEFKIPPGGSRSLPAFALCPRPRGDGGGRPRQDCYFDTADGALAQEGKSLVIRTMHGAGIGSGSSGAGAGSLQAVSITDADKAASMVCTLATGRC